MVASIYAFASLELRRNPENIWKPHALPEDRPITELIWAENSAGYFDYEMTPIPQANKPDFQTMARRVR
jgi:hypothetical protein